MHTLILYNVSRETVPNGVSQAQGISAMATFYYELGVFAERTGLNILRVQQIDWRLTQIDVKDYQTYIALKLNYAGMIHDDQSPATAGHNNFNTHPVNLRPKTKSPSPKIQAIRTKVSNLARVIGIGR